MRRWGGLCGGSICVGVAMLGATGANRMLMPVHVATLMPKTPAPRGVPVIFPLARVGALAGIFMFTFLGAAVGASKAGAGHSAATPLRALLAGAVGMLPVGL